MQKTAVVLFNAEGRGTALYIASFPLLSSGLLIEMPDVFNGTQISHFQTESENQWYLIL